jgi:hypothetical protein
MRPEARRTALQVACPSRKQAGSSANADRQTVRPRPEDAVTGLPAHAGDAHHFAAVNKHRSPDESALTGSAKGR